ncbi:MAG: DinB family protein [Leptospira sp.]|nr:DinB family protein [Leptospira sp.]
MNIIEENLSTLVQGISLIQSLPDQIYSHCPEGFLSGIGGHVRHIHDFYQCFLNESNSHLNYDKRERNLEIEQSKESGIFSLEKIIKKLQLIHLNNLDEQLIVTCNETKFSNSPPMKSSIGRELQFLLSHTIHHYAIIKLMLMSIDIGVDVNFGLAPSTIEYMQRNDLSNAFSF